MADSQQEMLLTRLAQYPVDRYPVQNATTQFHLGSVLLQSGETEPALPALTAARDLFQGAGMRLEQAKATVMLGVALRMSRRFDEAATAFSTAAGTLGDLDQPVEQAAAFYNLGLVRQDSGDIPEACAAWSQARELFTASGYLAQAGAAARDHGAALLTANDVGAALPLLEEGLALAEQTNDELGAGLAANALGLAQLAAADSSAAVGSLRRALAAFPRSVRPADYAMVKANLALAHEHADDLPRARLAARQALAISSAAAPVRAQAQEILARLPGQPDRDLQDVLSDGEQDLWPAIIREEVLRAGELPAVDRRHMVSGFLDGVLARPAQSYDLAECLLQVIIELPPRPYAQFVSALVEACAGRPEPDTERLHSVMASALARFAMPQWQRLVESLNAAASEAGEPATWR